MSAFEYDVERYLTISEIYNNEISSLGLSSGALDDLEIEEKEST